jgi:hypothetical protein
VGRTSSTSMVFFVALLAFITRATCAPLSWRVPETGAGTLTLCGGISDSIATLDGLRPSPNDGSCPASGRWLGDVTPGARGCPATIHYLAWPHRCRTRSPMLFGEERDRWHPCSDVGVTLPPNTAGQRRNAQCAMRPIGHELFLKAI